MAGSRKLTTFEAVSIVAGTGIGGGVMAVPYLASRSGYIPLIVIAAVAFSAALLLHLMLLEACLKSPGMQILSVLDKFLFKGNKALIYLFFGLIAVGNLSNLAAYILGGASVTEGWGIPPFIGGAIFYGLCALIIVFGIKSVGIGEKAAMLGMIGIAAYISVISLQGGAAPQASTGDGRAWLALYGMLMFCLGAYLAIPQVVDGLEGDGKAASVAVSTGVLLNLVITVAIALSVMRVSDTVTKVAIVGWSEKIGGVSGTMGSLFVWLAMATSFWGMSFAFKDIIMEQFGVKSHMLAWLMCTAPAVMLLALGSGFIELLKLAGGATALILIFTLIPAFKNSRKQEGRWSLGFFGGTVFQVLVALAYLAMAAGSLIPVD